MRVAIVHDWLVTNAGAEKVLRSILNCYPDATLFALVDFLSEEDRTVILDGRAVTTSFIQHLPLAKRYFRHYLPLFPRAIESLDMRGFDLIISSSWAVAKGVKKHAGQLHVCYCHTPIRYAWDLYEEYTASLSQPKKFLVEQSLKYLRNWDIATLDRVDYFIANSQFVQERIARTYGRESHLIYPPVALDRFTLQPQKSSFFLTASRLVPYKKTKLIVEAFNQMPHHTLVVIGAGEEYEEIARIAGENIQLLGFQEDATLIETMQHAQAFVYAAVEDFGIVPIEAMACGTPVIALDQGGTKETITEGVTGVHFATQSIEAIIDAVERFEQYHFDPTTIRQEAMSYGAFEQELVAFITGIY